MVKTIDQKVSESGKSAGGRRLGTFVIVGDANGRADQLRELALMEGLKNVNLCIGQAPPRYEVSKDADVTVVIYNPDRPGRQQVVANFALRKGELDCAKSDAIVAAVVKAMPAPPAR